MAEQLKKTLSETVVAVDSSVVHNTGVEVVSGSKTFANAIQVGNDTDGIFLARNKLQRITDGGTVNYLMPSSGGRLATEEYVATRTDLVVTASYSSTDGYSGILSGLSHTYGEVSAALYGGRNVVLEVDPGETFVSLDKMVFHPVRVDAGPSFIRFVSFSDPDDDGWFWANIGPNNWHPVNYQPNVSDWTGDRLVCREWASVDVSELPDIVIYPTYGCFQRYNDNSGKVPVLGLDFGGALYVHLTGSVGGESRIDFNGVVYVDFDGTGEAPWLLSVTLEPPLEDGDPDRWTVTKKKLSDKDVFTVNADLSLSTMTISNADKTLSDALAAVASGGVVRLVLNGVWTGWTGGVDSNAIMFSLALVVDLGDGEHPYIVRAVWSNDGDEDTWNTTVEELATTGDIPPEVPTSAQTFIARIGSTPFADITQARAEGRAVFAAEFTNDGKPVYMLPLTDSVEGQHYYFDGVYASSTTGTSWHDTSLWHADVDSSDAWHDGYIDLQEKGNYVPTSRRVNGKALTTDIVLSASDVSAVPVVRKVNGNPLSADVVLGAADVGAVPVSGGVFDGGVYAGSVSADSAHLESAWAYTLGNYDGGVGLLVPSGAYPGDSVARTSDLTSLSMGGYAFNSPAVTFSATDAADDTASFSLANLSVNAVALGDGVEYVDVTFPPKDATFARDFFLRLTLSGSDVPTITFREPDGSDLNFDADDGSWADVARGVNILMFTETAR